jgi:hypothetical protein
MTLLSPPQPGKLGQVLPRILQGQASSKAHWWALPKFICWQIWITRNRNFFQGKASLPQTVAANAKQMLSESINSRPLKIEDLTNWTVREKDWMASFNLRTSKHTKATTRSSW